MGSLTARSRSIDVGHPLSIPVTYPGLMLHPLQTDTFDPSSPDLIYRVQSGERLTWLYLGATVYRVDGE
jgi:hypothetical protein